MGNVLGVRALVYAAPGRKRSGTVRSFDSGRGRPGAPQPGITHANWHHWLYVEGHPEYVSIAAPFPAWGESSAPYKPYPN